MEYLNGLKSQESRLKTIITSYGIPRRGRSPNFRKSDTQSEIENNNFLAIVI